MAGCLLEDLLLGALSLPSPCCSCRPNAETLKQESDVDGYAMVRALRTISPGEELTISYIDLEEEEPVGGRTGAVRRRPKSLEERRAELRDYGFVCRCQRCLEEEASAQPS